MNERVRGLVLRQMQQRLLESFVVDVKAKQAEAVATETAPATPKKTLGLYISCDPKKTLAMRLIEDRHQRTMEELLDVRLRGSEVARYLGVTGSTVSKWRKDLGMRGGGVEQG